MRSTVLIVDDHAGFRRLARALLEADGYSVVGEAVDGRSALESARTLRPDVVLLDVQLPDVDGFRVAEWLAEGGGAPAVVLTSTRDAADYATRVARSPARGFVAKGELSGATIGSLLG
jgi:DNA-binding NarL/FixJ family response regulator